MRIGAPGSVARFVEDNLANNPAFYGSNHWLVYEYATGRDPILRAAQPDRVAAERYMKPGRVLYGVK